MLDADPRESPMLGQRELEPCVNLRQRSSNMLPSDGGIGLSLVSMVRAISQTSEQIRSNSWDVLPRWGALIAAAIRRLIA